MKIYAEAELLEYVIKTATQVAIKKGVNPIAKNVLIEAAEDCIEICATNFDTDMRVRIEDCEVDSPGKILLPAHLLAQILKTAEGLVSIESETDIECVIKNNKDSYTLQTENPCDFPVIEPICRSDDGICIGYEDLATAWQCTHFAVSRDRSRYTMDGLLIEASGDKLSLVGCDGRRLSVASIPYDGVSELYAIVRPDSVKTVISLCSEKDCKINDRNSKMLFSGLDWQLSTRTMAGEYPTYRDAIPSSDDYHVAIIRTNDMVKALKKATIIGARTNYAHLDFGTETLKISMTEADSSSQIAIDLLTPPKKTAEILIRPQYLLDVLSTIDNDSVVSIQFCNPKKAIVIDDEEAKHVIMPGEM